MYHASKSYIVYHMFVNMQLLNFCLEDILENKVVQSCSFPLNRTWANGTRKHLPSDMKVVASALETRLDAEHGPSHGSTQTGQCCPAECHIHLQILDRERLDKNAHVECRLKTCLCLRLYRNMLSIFNIHMLGTLTFIYIHIYI